MPKNDKAYFEYDWSFCEKPALYRVDLDFLECAKIRIRSGAIRETGSTPLMTVTVADKRHCMLTAKDVQKLLVKSAKLASASCACLVGSIHCGLVLMLYLYEGESGSLDTFAALIAKEKGFDMRTQLFDEEDFKTYRTFLMPNDAKLQTVRNLENLEFLRERGDTLAPRRLNLHMAFPSEPASIMFAPKALENGFAVGAYEDTGHSDLPFGLVIHRVCELNKPAVDSVTTAAIALASEFGGKLIFWDCPGQSTLKRR